MKPLASTSSEAKPSSALAGRSVKDIKESSVAGVSPVLQPAVPVAAALQAASAPLAAVASTPPPAVMPITALPPVNSTTAQAAAVAAASSPAADKSAVTVIRELSEVSAHPAPLQAAAAPAEDAAASTRVSSFFEHAVSHLLQHPVRGHVVTKQGAEHLALPQQAEGARKLQADYGERIAGVRAQMSRRQAEEARRRELRRAKITSLEAAATVRLLLPGHGPTQCRLPIA